MAPGPPGQLHLRARVDRAPPGRAARTNFDSPCSRHPGCVRVMMCDVAVRFITHSIDQGSPWRPLATIADGEVVENVY
ncbi:MAG: hypothetical protein CMJ81_05380 [Planctomycetaceae bacterium]|nr:hypothetical protein [Planctomycetaceae bacterium]